jgi:hypothetical protein
MIVFISSILLVRSYRGNELSLLPKFQTIRSFGTITPSMVAVRMDDKCYFKMSELSSPEHQGKLLSLLNIIEIVVVSNSCWKEICMFNHAPKIHSIICIIQDKALVAWQHWFIKTALFSPSGVALMETTPSSTTLCQT